MRKTLVIVSTLIGVFQKDPKYSMEVIFAFNRAQLGFTLYTVQNFVHKPFFQNFSGRRYGSCQFDSSDASLGRLVYDPGSYHEHCGIVTW